MRTVSGRTDHVVVVGAGLSGLSTTLRLLAAGRAVTLLERADVPGGRAGLLELGGYRFDTGPTVLTMPDLIAEALGCVGEEIHDWLQLERLDPAYRAKFADGSTIDVHADVEAMSDEVRRICGPAAVDGYRRFVRFARELYELELPHFIDRNFDSPLDLVSWKALRLLRIGGFRRLSSVVSEHLPDERLRRLFSFQALYAGLSPYDALALYAVISYLDCVAGVYAPVGGMHAVPRALAGAAAKHGAEIRYGVDVERVEFFGDRAVAVITAEGDRVGCDAVVLTADLPVAWRTLLAGRRPPARLRRLRFSPSCVLLHAGTAASWPEQAHHTVHFGAAWRSSFDELIDEKRPMTDPSLLVSVPTVTDPSLAPPGRSAFHVVAPAPNLTGRTDWQSASAGYRDDLVKHLESLGYQGFADVVEVERLTTPADWAAQGMAAGTPFAMAHTFWQTGPFRPSNLAFENVVFAGSGTRPGVGVPMVLLSGRLAAERIVGAGGAG